MSITLYSQFTSGFQNSMVSYQDSLNARTPQAASEDTVLNRLAENIPGMSAGDLKSLDSDDFSPEKVANRIGDFVAQGLEAARRSGRSEEDIQNMYNAAVSGVEKGFAEARDILDNLGALKGSIAENIDETEKQTFAALDAINPSAQDATNSATISRLTAAERYEQSESLSLKVTTQDGDEVTINFSNQSRYEQSFGVESDCSNTSALFNISRSEASNYQFSVNGDLDNDEIDALQNLIKDVNEIAGEFFDGDIQRAFDIASEYQMDKSELSSMNLQLTQTEQYSSVAKYSQVENQNAVTQDAAKRLGNYAQSFENASAAPTLDFVKEIREFSQTLLESLVTQDARYREADSEQQNRYNSQLDAIAELTNRMQPSFVHNQE